MQLHTICRSRKIVCQSPPCIDPNVIFSLPKSHFLDARDDTLEYAPWSPNDQPGHHSISTVPVHSTDSLGSQDRYPRCLSSVSSPQFLSRAEGGSGQTSQRGNLPVSCVIFVPLQMECLRSVSGKISPIEPVKYLLSMFS